jgi:hypothetical protein
VNLTNEAIDDVLDVDYDASAVRKQFNLAPRISTLHAARTLIADDGRLRG